MDGIINWRKCKNWWCLKRYDIGIDKDTCPSCRREEERRVRG